MIGLLREPSAAIHVFNFQHVLLDVPHALEQVQHVQPARRGTTYTKQRALVINILILFPIVKLLLIYIYKVL